MYKNKNEGSAMIIVLIIFIISFAISYFEIKTSKLTLESTEMLINKLHAIFGAESEIEKLKFYISTGQLYKNKIINRSLPNTPDKLYLDGRIQKLDKHSTIIMTDSGNKLNLNSINKKIMLNLLKLKGLKEKAAVSAVNSILDWYDLNSTPRFGGAEIDFYKRKGMNYKPRNCSCIQSIYELRLIKGLNDPKVFNFIKNYLIISPYWHINLNTVDEYMLSAILGIPLTISKSLIKLRSLNNSLTPYDIRRILGYEPPILSDYLLISESPTFVIDIKVNFRFNDAKEEKECVIFFKQDNKTPYKVLKWVE